MWRGNRRNFLKTVAAIGATALLYNSSSGSNPLVKTVDRIRTFEAEIGNNDLTFESANTYIPLVAKLFAESTGSSKTAEELVKNTYTIRGEPQAIKNRLEIRTGPVKDPYSFKSVQKFKEDYPKEDITEDLAQVIAGNSNESGGFYWNGKVFLVIGDTPPQEISGMVRQYRGDGLYVKCEPESPIVKTRHRLLHEYTHAGNLVPWIPLEERFFRSFFSRDGSHIHAADPASITEKNVVIDGIETNVVVMLSKSDPKMEVWYSNGMKSNFMIYYRASFPNDERPRFEQIADGLNEYVTDYLASRISVHHDLPYTTSPFADPWSFANFDEILRQSGIGYQELLNLYHNSQITEFYLKIADGAQNINFSTMEERLRFGLKRIDPWSEPYFLVENYFTPYYPNVNTQDVRYMDPSLYQDWHRDNPNMVLGCI
ncbi:MAG: twin-arginine translocation signal domain-containing protein [Candidatus Aenigmarchaeota archaeon]|nr:twin-arginine translocation signal domain-containing protein [Candidatus Aenigmarchaeota archaeon]